MFKLTRFCLINNYKFKNFIRLSSKLSNKPPPDNSLDSTFNNINHLDESIDNEEFGIDDKKFEQLSKLNVEKSELTKFREDIKQLSLAECLIKYECSIKDALKLDPKLQKRIIIKGTVIDRVFRSNKLKLKIIDTNTFDMIRVYIPYHVYENRLDQIYKGSSIVVTGLVFEAIGLDLNSLYCDKIVYVNHTTSKWSKRLFEQTNTIKDIIKLRNYPVEKFRSLKSAALIKLRSEFISHLHNLMNDEQFIHVTIPILTSFPIQNNETFEVRNQNRDGYFHTPVYLIQHSDKHLESIVNAIPQIYTITHSFNSNYRRSKQISNELLVLEVCQATDDKLDDLMNQVEYFLKKLTSSFDQKSTSKSQLRIEEHKYESKLDKDFNYIRMTYNETIELLKQKDINLQLNEQLTFYHKQIISQYFENYPVFIYDFPFNLETDYDTLNLDGKAQRFELLIGKGLTACKGKIKSNDNYDELSNKLKELNYDLTQDTIQWYLDLKKKGCVPCSWFSLSIDQYLMTFTDLTSLRDIILFPRFPNYCEL